MLKHILPLHHTKHNLYKLHLRNFSKIHEIKAQIDSIKNIKNVCVAMRSIAIGRIANTQSNCLNGRPFSESLEPIWNTDNDFESQVKRILIVPFTSTKGLCGPINSNLVRKIRKTIFDIKQKKLDFSFIFFGERGRSALNTEGSKRFNYVFKSYDDIKTFTFDNCVDFVEKYFFNDRIKFDKIMFFYTYFDSRTKFSQRLKTFYSPKLALSHLSHLSHYENEISGSDDHIHYENLYKLCLANAIYASILEHLASEQASRMAAMDRAINNIDEIVNERSIFYFKERQNIITQELCEITSGFSTLSEEDSSMDSQIRGLKLL